MYARRDHRPEITKGFLTIIPRSPTIKKNKATVPNRNGHRTVAMSCGILIRSRPGQNMNTNVMAANTPPSPHRCDVSPLATVPR
jgi:hypothetical protein